MGGISWLLIIGVALVGAVTLAILHYRNAAPVKAVRHWPAAPGVILGTRVDEPVPGGPPVWRPLAHYRYRVGDRDLEGVQIRPGHGTESTREAAYAVIARYPVGAQVPVRFNPYRPEESLLELPPHNSGLLVGAGVLALIALLPLGLLLVDELDLFEGRRSYTSGNDTSIYGSNMMTEPLTMDNGMSGGMGGGNTAYGGENMSSSGGGTTSASASLYPWIVGRWAAGGNCSRVATFYGDGRLVTTQGKVGTWDVEAPGGGRSLLRIHAEDAPPAVYVEQAGPNGMRMTNPANTAESVVVTRCS